MPPSSRVTVASAGSGKTTWIVQQAIDMSGRAAIVSYTNNNEQRIREKFGEEVGAVPRRVTVSTWFGLLLRDMVRPYQNFLIEKRISNMQFVSDRSDPYARKDDVQRYFLNPDGWIYSDKMSAFALRCNDKSKGLVFDRLKALYDVLFIDEAQDLAGYDLDLVEAMMRAGIRIELVGDTRQSTYATNNAARNGKYRGPNIIKKFREWEEDALCGLEEHAWSHRCNQAICDLADSLFPDYKRTESRSTAASDHEGLFVVPSRLVQAYAERHDPQVLVFNKNADSRGLPALNFGAAKGLQFPRVLIIPTKPILQWLRTGRPSVIESESSRAKLYVAITRAHHSVAFVHDGECALPGLVQVHEDDFGRAWRTGNTRKSSASTTFRGRGSSS